MNGVTCPKCNHWVPSGSLHYCEQQTQETPEQRIAVALERIADVLEKWKQWPA